MQNSYYKKCFLSEQFERVEPKHYKYSLFLQKTYEFFEDDYKFGKDLLYLGTSNARGLVRPKVVLPSAEFPYNVHVLSIPGGGIWQTRIALQWLLPRLPNLKKVVIVLGSNELSCKKGPPMPPQDIADALEKLMHEIQTLYPRAEIVVHAILPIPNWAITASRAEFVSTNFLKPVATRLGGVFLESPSFLLCEFGDDKVHLTGPGLLKLWRNIERQLCPWIIHDTNLNPEKMSRQQRCIRFTVNRSCSTSEKKSIVCHFKSRYHAKLVKFTCSRFGFATFEKSFHVRRLCLRSKSKGGIRWNGLMFQLHLHKSLA